MKWILLLFMGTGAAPVTPEHYLSATLTFDDRLMCEVALDDMRTGRIKLGRWRVEGGLCAPSSSQMLTPDRRRHAEEKFPQHLGR